jgi:glycosyltransferase involved in cell wall biosynthesis
MACRVPVVVSEDTGTKELVREDVNGWVVPTGCLDALVAAIERARRRLS